MTLVYRSVKGSPLTSAEGDGNIHDLDDRITAIEDSPPEAVSIDDITQAGDQITVLLTDSTERGPFTLPSGRPNFLGEWQPATSYAVNDWITSNGSLYAVIFAHTSDSDFDPGANDGLGHDYYMLLLSLSFAPPVISVSSTTLLMADLGLDGANRYYRCSDNSGCLVTLPLHSTLAFPINTEFQFRQCGAATVQIAGETNTDGDEVIINTIDEYLPETALRGGVIIVKKIDDNEWDCWGLLTPESV